MFVVNINSIHTLLESFYDEINMLIIYLVYVQIHDPNIGKVECLM